MALSPKTELASLPKVEKEIAASESPEVSMPTRFGMLFFVPPEIRQEIYRDLIAAGSVRFLETSKAVHSEAIDTFLQEAVCRLEFNICKPLLIYPGRESSNTILNLEILLNMNDMTHDSLQSNEACFKRFNEWWTLISGGRYSPRGFVAPIQSTPRKSCKIVLENYSRFHGHVPRSTFVAMRFLTDFETVVLAIAGDHTPETKRQMVERIYDPRPDPQRNVASAMHNKVNTDTFFVYQIAGVALEPTLGPVKWITNEKGAHLNFHPREKG